MKKGLLILPLLASFALGGCDLFGGGDEEDWFIKPEITGGTKAEKTAIYKAVNNLSICTNPSGTDLFPTSKNIRLYEDEQDYIRVLNKVTVDKLTVNITWDLKKSQKTFDDAVSPDNGVTNFVYMKYPGPSGTDSTYQWGIKKITCGGATSTKANFDCKATVVKGTHPWTPMTMEQILAVTDSPSSYTVDGVTHSFESTSNILDYEAKVSGSYNPWWNGDTVSTDGRKFYEAEVKGKIIFLSEDGNWGLLQNGSHVLELYSGNAYNLNEAHFPELKNKYVSIKGEVASGYGNFQLSFIKSIRAIDKSQVTEPTTTFLNLTNEILGNAKLQTTDPGTSKPKFRYKQFTSQFEHNQLVQLTGKVTTVKADDGTSGRFTVGITPNQVGTEEVHEIFIGYDYHTDRTSKKVRDALLAKNLNSKGTAITIKGTIRFTDGVKERHKAPLSLESNGAPKNGTWNITPFDVSHVA